MNVTEIVIILTIFVVVVLVLIAIPIIATYKKHNTANESIDLSKEIRGWRNKQVEDTDKKSQTLGDA